jgi:tetratricopeptide (TPR) repeat protein
VFHQSPLFPLLLSVIYTLAPDVGRAAWSIGLQVLLGSAAMACLVPLGRLGFGRLSDGVAAAVLALLYGPFVFYTMKLLPVPLALATQAAGLATLLLARSRARSVFAAVAGVTWGIACLARSEMLIFVPFALAALGQRRAGADGSARRRLPVVGAYLAGLVLAVAPATVHNLRQGDLVLVASAAGENLFVGNQRGAEGGYKALHERAGNIFTQRVFARRMAERAHGRDLLASEVSAYWRGRALREITDDPGAWIVLEARKLGRLLHPGDPTDIYSFALERNKYLPSLHAHAITPWALLLLGAVGTWLALRGAIPGVWPIVALAGVHLLLLLAFFVDARLRLPLLFVLCPLGGHALAEGLRRWRAGTQRRAIATMGVLLVAALVVGAVATRPTTRDVVRLASVLSMQQRLDESLQVLAPHVSGPAADPLALDQAGWVLQKRGDFAEARERYVAALAGGLSAGREKQTRTRLAMVHEQLGQIDEAAAQHDAAVESEHADAGTFYERAMFRLRRQNVDGAREDLRRAARLDPTWPAPRNALRSLEPG